MAKSNTGPPPRPVGTDLGVLDALRGLAALYVVAFHARMWLWVPSAASAEVNPAHSVLTLLWDTVGFGGLAVMLFFLISGFCIHYRQARKLANDSGSSWLSIDLGAFALRRGRRLYPPLLVALALTATFDFVGARLNPAFYAGQTYIGLSQSVENIDDHQWSTLIGNLGFQASLSVPVFGTDTPLWSLSYEFWYYVLYPVVLLASARFGLRGILAISTVSLLAVVCFAYETGIGSSCFTGCWSMWVPDVLAYWLVWNTGAVIAEMYAGRIRVPPLNTGALVATVGLGVLAVNELHPRVHIDSLVRDMLFSAGLAATLAWVLLACPRRVAPWVERGSRMLRPLGNISYSLYLVHMPWLVFLCAVWLAVNRSLPSGVELAGAGVVGALALATVCWLLVERHCVSTRPKSRGVTMGSTVPQLNSANPRQVRSMPLPAREH